MFERFVLVLLLAYRINAEVCADLDTKACVLLQTSQPRICEDHSIADGICKKHCGNCPIQCYDCSNPLMDPMECLNSTTCSKGQGCSVRELRAADGRHEYTLGCISDSICDGAGIDVVFGRRDVDKRDISIHCCNTDLCNREAMTTAVPTTTAPMTTTATRPNCVGNIEFLIDETDGVVTETFKDFVKQTVMALGVNSSRLYGINSFDNDLNTELKLHRGESLADVLLAIDKISQDHGTSNFGEALHHFDNLIAHTQRSNIKTIVVVSRALTDDLHHRLSHDILDIRRHNPSINLVLVETSSTGSASSDHYFDHVVQLGGQSQMATIVQDLLNVIC